MGCPWDLPENGLMAPWDPVGNELSQGMRLPQDLPENELTAL